MASEIVKEIHNKFSLYIPDEFKEGEHFMLDLTHISRDYEIIKTSKSYVENKNSKENEQKTKNQINEPFEEDRADGTDQIGEVAELDEVDEVDEVDGVDERY